jgi:hypothetical protein
LQVGFESDIGAERLRANFLQRRKFQIWSEGERRARFTGNLRRIEEKKFVDDTREECGAVELRSRFEENAKDSAAAELGENRLQTDSAGA